MPRGTLGKREQTILEILKKYVLTYIQFGEALDSLKKPKKLDVQKSGKIIVPSLMKVYPSYKDGLLFRRPDISKPYSKDNFIWLNKENESAFKSNSVYLEYNGERLLLKDWADKLNLSLAGLRIRYHRHKKDYSNEEILFGKKKSRGTKNAKGITDDGVNIRAKASKMISSYKNKDRKMGISICDMDINWVINNIFSKPCVYCGDTYRIGADRIDNTKGHTKDNVVPCCYECNCARNSNFTFEEMQLIGKVIGEVKKQRNIQREDFKSIIEEGLNIKNPSMERWGKMKVYQYDLDWNLINTYDSVNQAAKETGFTAKGIGAACNGKDYNSQHKYKGYKWEHK